VDDRAAPPDAAPTADASPTPDAGPTRPLTVLRVHYPAGSHRITVRGSTGPWNWSRGVAATAGAEDTWTFTTDALTEPAEWKPLLDDETWSRGPNYRVAPGETVDVYPHFLTARGRVVNLIPSFHSNALDNNRAVWAYLPPSYDENTRARFPVVYMHDGQNLFDPARAFGGNEWRVDETMDAAAEDGSIAEAIVIGPENTAGRIYEYTPTRDASIGDGGGGDRYLQLLVDELKPVVDGMLRTRPDRASTAVLGSSLGGLISAYAGLRRPAVFGLVGAMSPSTWWDNRVILGMVAMTPPAPMRPLRVYVDSGDSGPSRDDVTNTNMLAAQYQTLGYVEGRDFHHVVQAGAQHNEFYWAQRLPGALRFLLGPGR
jgi:predicted alpha/beta superfamily hydrolase